MTSLRSRKVRWSWGLGLLLASVGCGDDGGLGQSGSSDSSTTDATSMGSTGSTLSASSLTASGTGDSTVGPTTNATAPPDGTSTTEPGTTTDTTSTSSSTGPGSSSGGESTGSTGGPSTGSSSGGGGPGCGDGSIDPGEQCDGADLQGFDCASLGLGGGVLACDPVQCIFDVSGCGVVGGCGDGIIDPGEQCDGANLQGFDCVSLGLGGGTLACDPVMCTFDTSMCMPGGGTSG